MISSGGSSLRCTARLQGSPRLAWLPLALRARGPGASPRTPAQRLAEPACALSFDADLHAIEAFLGSPTVLDLSPAADPSLWRALAARGYALRQFQQMWFRTLDGCGFRVAYPKVEMVRMARSGA